MTEEIRHRGFRAQRIGPGHWTIYDLNRKNILIGHYTSSGFAGYWNGLRYSADRLAALADLGYLCNGKNRKPLTTFSAWENHCADLDLKIEDLEAEIEGFKESSYYQLWLANSPKIGAIE